MFHFKHWQQTEEECDVAPRDNWVTATDEEEMGLFLGNHL